MEEKRKIPVSFKLFNRNVRDFTSGSISKNIWILAWPMMIGNVLQTAFNVVDMIFVGKLGPEAIAAVSLSGMILMLIITIIVGIGIGTTAMVARFIGAKEYSQANEVALQSILFGGISSFLLAVVGFFYSEFFLKIFGAEDAVVRMGTDYLRIMFLGSFTMFLLFLGAAILRGAGDALTPMLILVFSTLLNVIADPLLIFGLGPFPRLEIAGAALATVFARGTGMIIILFILIKGYSYIKINLKDIKLRFDILFRIIRIAIPGSLQMGIRSVSGLILMSVVVIYGTYALAAYGIGLRINMIVMMPGFGLGAATATLVGQNLGAKKPRRAEKSAWIALIYYESIMLAIGSVFYMLAPKIIFVFNNNPEVIREGVSFLHIVPFSYIFLAMGIVLHQSLHGAGDTLPPMIITGISLLGVRIPLALFLPKMLPLDTQGIWLAIAMSTVLEGSVVAFWFKSGRWKKKKI
ncbi:MAG: MATE family efflux transporter [Candidatus Aminicenantaceae bacterium]